MELAKRYIALILHPDGAPYGFDSVNLPLRETYEEAMADAERNLELAAGKSRSPSLLHARIEERLYRVYEDGSIMNGRLVEKEIAESYLVG